MSWLPTIRRIPRSSLVLVALGLAVLVVTLSLSSGSPQAATAPPVPAGLTATALDARVALAWQPSSGATGYTVLRGTSQAAINQPVTPAGFSGTTFADTTAVNGQTYYYTVTASSGTGQSTPSQVSAATPRARSCSSGNAVVQENCFPGTTSWKSPAAARAYNSSIEGYASATSINAGDSVDLRSFVLSWDVPYHVDVYRTGWYGGTQGRLVTSIRGLVGQYSPDCYSEDTTTGLYDCSTSWSPAATLTTTNDWASGVYLLKFVRDDNNNYSESVLVVRNDGSHSALLFGVPTSTYAAYNRFGGKSLYDGLSNPPKTVSGGNRAVKSSFDRPFAQPYGGPDAHDWYPRTDVATVGWLERQGYDTTYIASEDLHSNGGQLKNHKVFLSGAHDEYWSSQMFDAAIAARNAGTSLVFLGANATYWKIRYEASRAGAGNRVVDTYKTVQGGPVDPSGTSTSTWRDPAGPNRPENELIGQMYIGENLTKNFPLQVSAAEGKSRVWRYTSNADLAPGTSATIGAGIVGWEWDARVNNGREPAGVATVASSPVTGQLLQGNGASQTPGSATQSTTIYQAPSGALVFSTGTINWWRGLGYNGEGAGEPDSRIQQATANVLADMGATPTTASGITTDGGGGPSVSSTVPAAGATGVRLTDPLKIVFDRQVDPATVASADFELKASDGTVLPITATLDNATRTVTITPGQALDPVSGYTASIVGGIAGFNGAALALPFSWTFSTGTGTPPTITARTPAAGATGAGTDSPVTATFDRHLLASSVNGSTMTLRPSAGGAAVAASVQYDDATRTARLTPNATLSESTGYTVDLSTGIQANDGVAMAAAASWTFTTGTNLQISSRTPAPFAFSVSPSANVRVTFSRAADAATITGSSLKLAGPGGQTVTSQIAYDSTTRTASLTPTAVLGLNTTYTVTATSAIHATDGAPLAAASWTFTTASSAPAAPTVTSTTPAAGATRVSNSTPVRATFDLDLDAATVTTQSFVLAAPDGTQLAAAVTYDAASRTATLVPTAALGVGVTYTARLTTAIRSSAGSPLAATTSWTFTTADCPCRLMTSQTPALTGLPVQDGRAGAGPFSYELGTKVVVDQTTQLIALRFWKDPRETGTHVGRVWNAAGTKLVQVTFASETASGWQRQALATPLTLQPGQTYVLSTGFNAYYTKTESGLSSAIASGPIRTVADNANGVYNGTAGVFPASSWMSSNYFVDGVVKLPTSPTQTPAVVSVTPTAGATGVAATTTVRATFDGPLDASTINGSTFVLRDAGGATVPASVSYDEATSVATLTPQSALVTGTSYTATLATGIRSDDETPMPSAYAWSFSTIAPSAPTVVSTAPTAGATDLPATTTVAATFDQQIDSTTLASGFTLSSSAGSVPASVAYDGTTRTATLTPSAALTPATTYTATVGTSVKSTRGVAVATPYTWSFTTSQCPCQLFNDNTPPSDRGLASQNWRSGTGPWSLELGVKITVTQPTQLTAVRFYKDTLETGTHVGRVWNESGTLLASATFTSETGSGWQQQPLASPLTLTPGQTYVVSVGANAFFGMTAGGLSNQIVSGPLRSVADGRNGVYADVAGDFPARTWGSSNYFVDAVVR